jgi:hypothetical protein
MNDTAVAAGLVAGGGVFLFQQDDAGFRALFTQFPCRGGADDAGADDDDVVCQLRLQAAEPFSIGNDWTHPSLSIWMVLARDSAPS